MNQTLFLIALQHELSMGIGCELELRGTLKTFMKICLTRLNLTSIHVYLHRDSKGVPVKFSAQSCGSISHYLSIPQRKHGVLYAEDPVLMELSQQISQDRATRSRVTQAATFLVGFDLPSHGVLIFESHYPITGDVQQALQPILKKLASCCYGSIVHEALLQEISARKWAEQRVTFQSNLDELTKLYNFRYFNHLLNDAYNNSMRTGTIGCALLIGLDRFKTINDTMGHDVGDLILVAIAQRLQTLARIDVNLARLRGDEFLILMPALGLSQTQALRKINSLIGQVQRVFERPVITRKSSYQVNCSIGYALFPAAKMLVNDVVKNAEIALAEAKRNKWGDGGMYLPEMLKRLQDRAQYIDEMKLGLSRGEFELHYQPQYTSDKELIGAEALLRWNNPVRGVESPAVYIPIAEDGELIYPLGDWVLQQACRDIKKLEQNGLPTGFNKISINVSPKQLIKQSFQQQVISEIEASGIRPCHLGLEITEHVLIDSFEETIEKIELLKDYGVKCSIDDFGTGYSSLTYLKKIPAFLIKIDRAFVTNVDQDAENKAIVSMIIALGKTLNMDVLAEGVEHAKELECLNRLGCDKYQGYYFDKPMPFERFSQLVAEHMRLDCYCTSCDDDFAAPLPAVIL